MKAARELEGLSQDNETIGTIDDPLEIREEGIRFALSLAGGQKTGFFFDQRDNRSRLARSVQGRSVLDVFSYVGAWCLSSEESRVGKECVSTCRSGWSPYH